MPSAKADIRLRPARQDELRALSALILRSKAHWGYDDAFLESCRPELTLRPADLAASAVVVAESDGRAIGVVQVAGASLEKLFVAPEAIGLGVGRRLLQEALAVARRAGTRELVVEADPGAAGFYERMGARRAGTAPSGSIPGRVLPRLVFSLAKRSRAGFPAPAAAANVRANPAKGDPRMAGKIDARLAELGIALPDAPAPAANYVPFVQAGDMLFISGQISQGPDGLIKGRLGEDMDVAAGAAAARRCGLSILAQARAALGGDLDRIVRVVKLGGFVNSTPDFTDQPKVINGCSDLMVEVLGDAGRHARAAVSAPALPLGVAVEIEAVLQVK